MPKKDDMNILITGYLDETKTTNIINQQLRRIEKKLKLNIGVDNKQLAGLVRDVERIQNKLKGKVTPISEKDTKQAKVFVDSIEKAIEKYSKLGQVKVDQKINPATKEIEAFKLAVTQADGKVKELQYDLARLKGIQGAGKFALTGETVKDNTASIRERQLQQEQQINRQIDQQNKKLKHQLEMYKQEASLKAKNLINANQNNKNFDNTAVKNWLNSVNALNTSTPMATQQMDRLRMQFRNIQADASNSTGQVSRFGSTMENAFGRMPIYMAASAALFAPFVALDRLIDTLYVLDERLVTIDKVTENADLASIFDNATEAAYKYGQAIDSALESLGEISKLGFNNAEAQELNNNAMLLQTVGEFKSNADAANYLVAIFRQYKLELADTAKVVDALNEVSNKTGADTVSLSQGLSKASASAATAGVSFHELNGMIATTQETLKISGAEAGTFYKTLMSRFLRDKTQSMLESVGIQTKEMSGELRSATDVLRDLGAQWDTYDSQTKNAIASQLGGGWHVAKTISLLENQDRVLRNTEVSMNSYGSASEELATFQEGLRFKTNTMIAAFQELAMTIGDNGARDGIVLFLESVTSLTQGFTQVTEATNGYNIKLPILIGLAYAGVKAFGALKVALTGVKSAMGIFGVGLIAVETIASMFAKSASAADLNTEAMTELAQKTSDQKNELKKLVETYHALEPEAKNNADKQKELQSVLSDIQTLAPHLIESTGKYGDALSLNKDKAADYIESLKEMSKEQFKMAQSANSVEMSTINVDLDKEQNKLNKLEKSVKDSLNRMQEYQKKYDVSGLNDAEEEYNKRRIELADKASEAIENGNKELSGKITLQLTEMLNEYAEYVKIIEDKSGKLAKYNDQISEVQKLEGKKGEIEARKKALDDLINSTDRSTSANKQNADSLNQLTGGVYDSAEGMEGLTDATSASSDADMEKLSSAERIIGVTDDQIDSIYEMIGTYQLLSQMENLSLEQKSMLANATEYLAGVYPDLVSGSQANIEMMKREIESTDVLRQAIQKMADGEVSAQDQMTISAAIGTKNRLNLLRKEIQAYNEFFAQANDNANTLEAEKLAMRRLPTIQVDIDSLTGDLDSYTSSLSKSLDINGRYTESLKETAKETEKSTYISDKFKQEIEKLNLALEKQRAIKAKFPQHSKQYQNALKAEIKLLEQQKKLTEDQSASLAKQISSGKIAPTGMVTGNVTTSFTKASGNSNAAQIWNFFKSKGFSDTVAAGIMGNLRLESGLNPNSINKLNGATGIAQWLGDRKTGLSSYAKSLGTSMYDLTTQLNYLWKELNGSEKKTFNYLQANQGASASTIAAAFDRLFERSEGIHIPQRQTYANQYLSQFSGTAGAVTVTSSNTDPSKQVAEQLQTVDQAKSDMLQLQQDSLALQSQIDELNKDLVESGMAYYDNLMAGVDRYLEKSEKYLAKYSSASEQYREELGKQAKQLAYKQELMEKEANYIREQIKSDKLSAAVKDELNTKLSELSISWWDVNEAMQAVQQNIIDSKMSQFSDLVEGVNNSISKSEQLMEIYGEGTAEYAKEQSNVIKQLKYMQTLYSKESSYIKEQLKNEKLSIEQKKELEKRLSQLSLTFWETENRILGYNKAIAEEAITVIKNGYEQQKDYAIRTKEEEIKQAEEAHQAKMDLLDEEMDRYSDAVNEKIKLMRREQDEDSFNKDIGKLQKDELDLVNQINRLSLDDSRETQLKKKELEEQLATLREQITDKQLERSYDLREQNLSDELESYQEEVQMKKDAEDDKFKIVKDRLDRERNEIERHYDQLINDEAYYAKLRSDIVEGNVDSLSGKLQEFLGNFKNYNMQVIDELGMSWQSLQNMINSIISLQGQMGNVTAPNGHSKDTDWNTYLNNKKNYASAKTAAERDALRQENDQLRLKWQFPEGSYDDLKNIKSYHTGGIVGGSTNRLGVLANKLFNVKPNEQIVKSLKGELQIPPRNLPNVFNTMKAALNNQQPSQPNTIHIDSLLTIGTVTKDANLNIDKLSNQMLDRLITRMKPYGFIRPRV
ncbi:phage tail tape measure protein [Bacillus infantis]|uniref:phage tail tape measure protein n=1 Tax=Bacillus infantis TaxID=324767 RepID=UPI003CFB8E3F